MQLLISDANILIDIEVGELLIPMFALDYQFVVPDVLFYEELEEHHAHLLDIGLKIKSFDEHMVIQVSELAKRHVRPSRNDLFALLLAQIEKCPLLTGDKHLKIAAENEKIEVRGTL